MKDDYCPILSYGTEEPTKKGFSCRKTVVCLYRNVVIMTAIVILSIRDVTWLCHHPDVLEELATLRARDRFKDPPPPCGRKTKQKRQQTYRICSYASFTVHIRPQSDNTHG